jgi:cytochrome c-type biogenesis protein CcmH/NrfG
VEARAGQATDSPVVPEVVARAASAPRPRIVDQWRLAAVLAVVTAMVAGLALVPRFAADLAYQKAVAAADAAYLDDAQTQLMRAISWTPQDAYLHQFLGEIYYRKALFRRQQRGAYLNEALVEFERSARLNPHEANTFTLIGWTYLYRGDVPAAEGAFLKAKGLDPNNPHVRYSLGTAYLWQKKLAQARAEMVFARQYLPNATEVLGALQEIERLEGAR